MSSKNELSPIFITAHLWQSHGWHVIPAQPNSKRLVKGFGIYQNKVEAGEEVAFWWRDRSLNLAVVSPPDGVILDFDRIEVYKQFTGRWPELAASYTEATPRGGRHVFLRTSSPVPSGLVLAPGIEVKRICLVSPSVVGGKSYKVAVPGEILIGNVLDALKPFMVEGSGKPQSTTSAHAYALPSVTQGGKNGNGENGGIISEVKARLPIVLYLRTFEPKLYLTGRGKSLDSRWLQGRCPWHDDHHPSLWVDTERNLWGCHGCGAHGDVVNWHAKRLGSPDMLRAARDLAKHLGMVAA